MNELVKKEYLVLPETMAVFGQKGNGYASLVIEKGKEFYCSQTPNQIMYNSCLAGGSTFLGRRQAVERLMKSQTNKKLPLLINGEARIYMLQLAALKNKESIWVSYQHVLDWTEEEKCTFILFRNLSRRKVNVSSKSFTRLYDRASSVIVRQNYDRLFPLQQLTK